MTNRLTVTITVEGSTGGLQSLAYNVGDEVCRSGLKLVKFETNIEVPAPLIDEPFTTCANAGPYLSPCPEGYDTVLGYLAKHHPGVLALMDDLPEASQRDGWWLTHRCRERGITPARVPACDMLQCEGIEEVNAYPTSLLAERFG